MSFLLSFAIAAALGITFVLGTVWWVFRRIRLQENKVLRHLPEAERETARPHLSAMVDLMWPGSHDIGPKLKELKESFLAAYATHAHVEKALSVYLSDALDERDKARGGPFLRGAHAIGG